MFWYDGDKAFEEGIADLKINGVKVVRLDQVGAFELKIMLELEDKASRYLIYAPYAEPALEKDWLLDIRLYSRSFNADRASMIANELDLNQVLRNDNSHRLQAVVGSLCIDTLSGLCSNTGLGIIKGS